MGADSPAASPDVTRLLKLARQYGDLRAISEARVSTLMMGSGSRLTELREEGADITTSRLWACMRWLADNWPADHDKPAELVDWEARNAVEGSGEPEKRCA